MGPRFLFALLGLGLVRGDPYGVSVGIAGRDFCVVAADATFRRGSVLMSGDHDKVALLDDFCVLAATGDAGEADEFCGSMRLALRSYKLRCNSPPTPAEAHHLARRKLIGLRKERRQMPKLNLLLGAFDPRANEASLYWLDGTGASHQLGYGAHGVGSALILGHLDRAFDPELTKAEALGLVRDALQLLHRRYSSSTTSGFVIKIVDRDGALPRPLRRRTVEKGATIDFRDGPTLAR
ncbi:nucleophile aminohydrolase [Pelagophyceae sp. CCMP2097]|nr:nucleophile aminohydrolase [Pelagophyceae sp. CCMP2097]